jgi:hypothetical protein
MTPSLRHLMVSSEEMKVESGTNFAVMRVVPR